MVASIGRVALQMVPILILGLASATSATHEHCVQWSMFYSERGGHVTDEGQRRRTRTTPIRRPKRPDKAPKRDRGDWLDAARKTLISDGIERVKVEPLAVQLGVTTGSFYHHFKNRGELLDQLLEDWEKFNSGPMFKAVAMAGNDPEKQIDALFKVWLAESDYSPAYDSAVRAWAHTSKLVEAVVRRVDEKRIELLKNIFQKFGYDEQRAFIRARIAYFHQVGYQALEIMESSAERLDIYIYYKEALVGVPPTRKN